VHCGELWRQGDDVAGDERECGWGPATTTAVTMACRKAGASTADGVHGSTLTDPPTTYARHNGANLLQVALCGGDGSKLPAQYAAAGAGCRPTVVICLDPAPPVQIEFLWCGSGPVLRADACWETALTTVRSLRIRRRSAHLAPSPAFPTVNPIAPSVVALPRLARMDDLMPARHRVG
jgi:hypothetical protein